jgi:hypothetical protein
MRVRTSTVGGGHTCKRRQSGAYHDGSQATHRWRGKLPRRRRPVSLQRLYLGHEDQGHNVVQNRSRACDNGKGRTCRHTPRTTTPTAQPRTQRAQAHTHAPPCDQGARIPGQQTLPRVTLGRLIGEGEGGGG